jgi:hypothetical protein
VLPLIAISLNGSLYTLSLTTEATGIEHLTSG